MPMSVTSVEQVALHLKPALLLTKVQLKLLAVRTIFFERWLLIALQ